MDSAAARVAREAGGGRVTSSDVTDLWSQLVLVPEAGWPSKSPRNLLGIWNIEHHPRFTELESKVGSSKAPNHFL